MIVYIVIEHFLDNSSIIRGAFYTLENAKSLLNSLTHDYAEIIECKLQETINDILLPVLILRNTRNTQKK